jgi:hypothetical protein
VLRQRRLRHAQSADGHADRRHQARVHVVDHDLGITLRRGIGKPDLQRRGPLDRWCAQDPQRMRERDDLAMWRSSRRRCGDTFDEQPQCENGHTSAGSHW